MKLHTKKWAFLSLAALLAGCTGGGSPDKSALPPDRAAMASKYLLAAEPASAQGVIDAKKQVEDGERVVVLGRIGGSKRPVTQGRASFTVVDVAFKADCNDDPDCWDFT